MGLPDDLRNEQCSGPFQSVFEFTTSRIHGTMDRKQYPQYETILPGVQDGEAFIVGLAEGMSIAIVLGDVVETSEYLFKVE
jgi:hypothetical protein